MLIPGNSQLAGDSESLQADVMRFMAIIAFCLIAILALVRNTEPAAETPPQAGVVPEPAPSGAHRSLPAEEPPTEITPSPAPLAAAPEPAPTPRTLPPQPRPVPELPRIEPVEQQTRATPPEPPSVPAEAPPAPAVEEAPPVSEPAPEDEGLILRFASDSDFLRLVARGEISVYAFAGTDVLKLNEGYRFAAAPSPGQVYELLPGSIPSLIVEALAQARPDGDGYQWGIALPTRISSRIQQHLETVSRGQLVIDRYGDVHHVAPS